MTGVALVLLSGAATAVYVLDPYQVLRRAPGTPDFSGLEFQIPGVARHYPYDAVVAGTSTSSNFLPADLARDLGWDAINFAIPGGSMRQQRAVLAFALATGKVRHVLWGLDPFAFRRDEGTSFPYYLYREPGWRTAPYFLSLGVLAHGVSSAMLPPARRTSLAQWNESRVLARQYHYGRAEVRNGWEYRAVLGASALPRTQALADQAVDDLVTSLVRASPGVEFRLVLPPYSILYDKYLAEERREEFDNGCRLDTAIVDRAGALANVRVYNFRDATDITRDFAMFKDLQHSSGEVATRIVQDVAAGRQRVMPGGVQQSCGRRAAAAAAFAAPRD